MAEQGRVLKIFRDGRKHERLLTQQLPTGAKANLETVAVMCRIVREDAQEVDLRNFVMREIIGLDKQTISEKLDAAFNFCRDKIVYKDEENGFETLADLWSCMYALDALNAVGDCAIKSVALATCLSFLDLKPYFVVIRQQPNVNFFNHVYCGCEIGGVNMPLDPTPARFRPGDELNSLERKVIQIYG